MSIGAPFLTRNFFVFVICAMCFAIPNSLLAQKSIELTEIFVVSSNEKKAEDYLKYMIPMTLKDRQEIISIDYSIEPDTLYVSRTGRTFAIWLANELNPGDSISIKTNMTISKYDFESAPKRDTDKGLTPWVNKTPYNFTKDSIIYNQIQSVADSLNTGETVSTLKNIFQYVQNKIEYDAHRKRTSQFDLAWKEGHGDCTEYAQIMVMLCDAVDIPTRLSKGKAFHTKSTVAFHDWLEAYIPGMGWVPFDPTFADTGEDHTSFSTLQNMYAYYSLTDEHQYFYTYPGIDFNYFIFYTDKIEALYNRCFESYNKLEFKKSHSQLDSLLTVDDDHSGAHVLKGMLFARESKFVEGKPFLERSLTLAKDKTEKRLSYYALANFYALEGKTDPALEALEKSIALGLTNANRVISTDVDLKSLYDHPKFIEIIAKLDSKK